MMALPLVMTGPGGDYVTRYEVRGRALVREAGPAASHDDTTQQQGGGLSGWFSRRQRRGDQQQKPVSDDQAGALRRQMKDQVDIGGPAAKNTRNDRVDVQATQAVMSAAETWMMTQQQAMRILARLAEQMKAPVEVLAASMGAEIEGRLSVSASDTRIAMRQGGAMTASAEDDGSSPAERQNHEACVLVAEIDHESDTEAATHTYTHSRPARGTRLFADLAGVGGRIGQKQGDRLRARRGADQKGSFGSRPQQGTLFDS